MWWRKGLYNSKKNEKKKNKWPKNMFQTFCYHSQKVTFHWQFSPQLEHSPSPVSVEPVEEKVVDKKFHFRFSTFFFVAVCFLLNFMNLLRSRRPTHIHTHSFKRSSRAVLSPGSLDLPTVIAAECGHLYGTVFEGFFEKEGGSGGGKIWSALLTIWDNICFNF